MAIHKLSAAQIAKLTKHGKDGIYGDGGNLWLEVTNNGAGASWLFRWTEPGTRRDRWLGLGSLHTVSLDRARDLAVANRLLLKEGKDPKIERDNVRLDNQIAAGLAKTVSQVADEYFELKIARKSPAWRRVSAAWLKTYVHDTIGSMPIQKADRNTILEKCGLRELWTRRHVTAKSVLMHLDRIFRLAISCKYYRGENPAAWTGGLEHVLPSSSDVHNVKHHPGLPYKDVGRFMEKLRAYRYTTASRLRPHQVPLSKIERVRRWRARQRGIPVSLTPTFDRPVIALWLEFVILTGVRISEVRLARWNEFDFENEVWNVPAANKKNKKTMRPIPITKSMLIALDTLQKGRVDDSRNALVFPGFVKGQPFKNTILANWLTESFKWERKITAHGFRSTLKDWWRANRYPMDWYEIQVDHVLGNKVGQAYGHDTMLDERRGIMKLWDEYCSHPAPEPQTGDVVNLSDKRRSA